MSAAELLARASRALSPVLDSLGTLSSDFAAHGYELALVGGPVRDAFLDRRSPDLDLTTDARPDAIEQILRGWAEHTWDVGRAFGTIGGRRGDQVVEVTTYRADAYEPGSRKPVVAFGDTLEADLTRRDFTVNAMALRLPERLFVDPCGGLEDLAYARLRTPQEPEVSFSDDPLRMMRAARFTSTLGLSIDAGVREAMTRMADRLSIVSSERVRDELTRLVLGADPRAGVELLVSTGLAEVMLPEVPALQLEVDEHHRHKDVYQHSLQVLDQAIALESPATATGADEVPGPDLVLRLAALLHDIGKPATRRFTSGGGVSFHHHEVVWDKLARSRLRALRYDKETVKDVTRLVELHLRFHGYGSGEWTDSAVRRYVTDAGDLLGRLHRLTRSDSTTRNRRKAARLSASYDDLERRIDRLREQEQMSAIRPELDGHQIAAVLGIEPGPTLGRAYKHMLELRLDRGVVGREEAVRELRRWWTEQEPTGGSGAAQ